MEHQAVEIANRTTLAMECLDKFAGLTNYKHMEQSVTRFDAECLIRLTGIRGREKCRGHMSILP